MAAEHSERGLDIPRRLVARTDGRLLLRHESRVAHIRLRARVQRPFDTRLRQTNHRPGADSAGTAGARTHGSDTGAARRPRCARECGDAAAYGTGRTRLFDRSGIKERGIVSWVLNLARPDI